MSNEYINKMLQDHNYKQYPSYIGMLDDKIYLSGAFDIDELRYMIACMEYGDKASILENEDEHV